LRFRTRVESSDSSKTQSEDSEDSEDSEESEDSSDSSKSSKSSDSSESPYCVFEPWSNPQILQKRNLKILEILKNLKNLQILKNLQKSSEFFRILQDLKIHQMLDNSEDPEGS